MNLAWNNINKIEGLEGLDQLRELDISNNQLSTLDGLKNLPNLRILNMTYNKLKATSLKAALDSLPSLHELTVDDLLKDACQKYIVQRIMRGLPQIRLYSSPTFIKVSPVPNKVTGTTHGSSLETL